MLRVLELDLKYIFEQRNLILNAIKNADGNNVVIVCDGNGVNRRSFKMLNTIEYWRTTDNMFDLIVSINKHILNKWITENCQEVNFHADA